MDRRRFARIEAPVFCRPIGRRPLGERCPAIDISAGGVRIYSDEKVAAGTKLELELFLPDASSISFAAEVVWVEALGQGAPARFDVGLKFLEGTREAGEKLTAFLGTSR